MLPTGYFVGLGSFRVGAASTMCIRSAALQLRKLLSHRFQHICITTNKHGVKPVIIQIGWLVNVVFTWHSAYSPWLISSDYPAFSPDYTFRICTFQERIFLVPTFNNDHLPFVGSVLRVNSTQIKNLSNRLMLALVRPKLSLNNNIIHCGNINFK